MSVIEEKLKQLGVDNLDILRLEKELEKITQQKEIELQAKIKQIEEYWNHRLIAIDNIILEVKESITKSDEFNRTMYEQWYGLSEDKQIEILNQIKELETLLKGRPWIELVPWQFIISGIITFAIITISQAPFLILLWLPVYFALKIKSYSENINNPADLWSKLFNLNLILVNKLLTELADKYAPYLTSDFQDRQQNFNEAITRGQETGQQYEYNYETYETYAARQRLSIKRKLDNQIKIDTTKANICSQQWDSLLQGSKKQIVSAMKTYK